MRIILPRDDMPDFIWTPIFSYCLIRDTILHLFNRSVVTGFEVKPVAARFATSRLSPPKLWELVVTGWAGMAKPESGVRLNRSESCSVCGELGYTGLEYPEQLIDEKQWDGSDIFMVWPLPRYVFVTDRVRQLVQTHGLTGCRFTRVEELEKAERFGPGRLHYYMPDARARKLGEPLGIY